MNHAITTDTLTSTKQLERLLMPNGILDPTIYFLDHQCISGKSSSAWSACRANAGGVKAGAWDSGGCVEYRSELSCKLVDKDAAAIW